MYRISAISIVFSLIIILNNSVSEAQNLLTTKLNNKTQLTVLNSRFGSRFSFSVSSSENAIRMGAMGYDLDEATGFYLAVENGDGNFCFRTIDRLPGVDYLNNQELDFGLTFSEMRGKTDGNIQVGVTIISPFTTSKNLDDEFNIKTQIVPAYYLITKMQNNSEADFNGTLKIGFKKTEVKTYSQLANRSMNKNSNKIYFRDNSNPESKVLLGAIRDDFEKFHNRYGVNGIQKNVSLKKGKSTTDTILIAGFYKGKVIRDLRINQDLRFYYTKFWNNVEEVFEFAKTNKKEILTTTDKFENIGREADATAKEKWVAALAFRSDMANSLLLSDEDGQSRFYLEEGRYQHLSTIDVAHETEVAAIFAPWRLKMQIEQWTNYLALKEVTVPPNKEIGKKAYKEGMTAAEYGAFLYHDVGDFPFVDFTSNYNYGPNMAVEENTDFVLLLYWYWKLTGDNHFVQAQLGITDILLQSVMNRDTDDSGIADTGFGWTTYDANDVLKLSPENTYLGVKQLCAYAVASEMFTQLAIKSESSKVFGGVKNVIDGEGVGFSAVRVGNEKLRKKQAEKYNKEAVKILKTLTKAQKKYGYIPICLDENFPGWNQLSVVIPEGLFLPGLAGADIVVLNKLSGILKDNYIQSFEKGKSSYGIRLVENESTTWFSKVMVSDIVASYWFSINNSTAKYAYEWNMNNPFAYNDGLLEADKAWSGYWYPRGVASILYLFRNQKNTGSGLLIDLTNE